MSENASTTELTSQYTAQVSADLERNTKEQERIGAEIAALQEQLAALQRDHQVLVSIQRAIEAAPASVEPAVAAAVMADRVAVPAPRKKAAAKSGTRTRAKKTDPGPRRDTAAKTGRTSKTGKTSKAKAAESTQPTLVELVRGHLAEQSEPRSAAEIATTLGQVHPDRNIKTTVVRTTLEGLVARTQAQRTKQGSSVFYTAPETPQEGSAPKTKEEPAPSGA
jgi:hypothetical protein